jgi:hypothetical protein
MKFVSKLYITGLLLLIGTSCNETLEEVNINPNSPSEPNAAALLPSVIVEPADALHSFYFNISDIIMQYHVDQFGNDTDLYILNGRGDGIWNILYQTFANLNDIEAEAIENNFPAYEAAAKILRSFYAATITEIWINAPYSEAGKGAAGISSPAYDTQESIYIGILSELEEANELLDTHAEFGIGGDVLYGGDVSKWKKLANSLRLRYLLRVSNVTSIDAASQINQIVSNSSVYPVFESNADNGIYDFSGEFPNVAGIINGRTLEHDFRSLSEHMVSTFAPLNDPRLDFYGNLPSNETINNHVGIPAGLDPADASTFNGSADTNTSLVTQRFFSDKGGLDFSFMTYSELQFILAEAAMKGWINGNPESYYNAGIQANFDYWGLTPPSDYFAQAGVAWNNTMQQLMDQKWMAYYFINTVESWGEYKRTGFPSIVAGPATQNTNGQIPSRLFYPILEQSLNLENYEAATAQLGGDILTADTWY